MTRRVAAVPRGDSGESLNFTTRQGMTSARKGASGVPKSYDSQGGPTAAARRNDKAALCTGSAGSEESRCRTEW